MVLDYLKELIPVIYGDKAAKILVNNTVLPHSLCFATHWHERMELLLILEGELTVHLGNAEIKAPAGSLVIVPPGKTHMGQTGEGNVSYRTIMFDINRLYNSSSISARFLEPIVSQKAEFVPLTDNKEIVDLALKLTDEQLNGDTVSPLIVTGKIYELLGLLYRYCLSDEKPTSTDKRFRDVLDYIENNFCEELSTASLCRRFGYNEAYFCRRFKTVTGLTPTAYIQILRLEKARKLIKTGEQRISRISEECGFLDPNYFSRCFKRHYGISPNEYLIQVKV